MKPFNDCHLKKHKLITVLAFVFNAPSLLMAEDRPGFYSPEFRSFERNYYDVSYNTSVGDTASTFNSRYLRWDGSEFRATQVTSSNDMDQYGFGISFVTPHVNRFSLGSSVNYTDWRSSASQDTWNGRTSTNDTDHNVALRFSGSYLLSDVSIITASLLQARSTSANQTHRDVSFEAASRVSDNVMLSGRISALWGDKHVPNGIKHVGGSLRYSESFGSIEANGSLDIYSATSISRSSVAGVATATEERFDGFGSGGAVYLKHDNSRFGVTASFGGTNTEGSPKNYSFGPRYIFTGSQFELTVSGNYIVSQFDDVATDSGVTNYSDTITKELRIGYVRDFLNGYYLDSSIVRTWNSSGSNIVGTQVVSQSASDSWSLNLGLAKRF